MLLMSSTVPDIRSDLTRAIRRVANPCRIILFGSQARGDANEHSDVDVLVIEEREDWQASSRRQEIGRLRRALPRLGYPIDVLLFTTKEFEHWQHAKNHVIAEAVENGVVLYERP